MPCCIARVYRTGFGHRLSGSKAHDPMVHYSRSRLSLLSLSDAACAHCSQGIPDQLQAACAPKVPEACTQELRWAKRVLGQPLRDWTLSRAACLLWVSFGPH